MLFPFRCSFVIVTVILFLLTNVIPLGYFTNIVYNDLLPHDNSGWRLNKWTKLIKNVVILTFKTIFCSIFGKLEKKKKWFHFGRKQWMCPMLVKRKVYPDLTKKVKLQKLHASKKCFLYLCYRHCQHSHSLKIIYFHLLLCFRGWHSSKKVIVIYFCNYTGARHCRVQSVDERII